MNKFSTVLKTTWLVVCAIVIVMSALVAFAYSKLFKRKNLAAKGEMKK